jgi:hypothetical protein
MRKRRRATGVLRCGYIHVYIRDLRAGERVRLSAVVEGHTPGIYYLRVVDVSVLRRKADHSVTGSRVLRFCVP